VKLPPTRRLTPVRTITVEFDANARGPWDFKPAQRSVQVHPGQLTTVMYEFQNVQNRRMAAQAIPSYAPARQRRISTSSNASASTSTRWSPAKRSSGRWPL
jgi:cytochrome c oxidase assembly protein Cox11